MARHKVINKMPREGWGLKALCRDARTRDGLPADAWFPEGAALDKQAQKAISVCLRCPVRTQCLGWAKKNSEKSGIWGGVRFSVQSKR